MKVTLDAYRQEREKGIEIETKIMHAENPGMSEDEIREVVTEEVDRAFAQEMIKQSREGKKG